MPECFLMTSPVFVHNNIAIYPTFRNDQLSYPREYHFTTDPTASEYHDPRSFDVRDYASLVPTNAGATHIHEYENSVFMALTENPDLLPKAKGEGIEDLTLDGTFFFRTTPEQDQAHLLAARISAQMENYWPAIDMHHMTMPNGDTKSIFTVPSGTTPGTELQISLIVYDQKVNSYDFQTLLTEQPDRTIQTNSSWPDLVCACCDTLGVERPDHLKTPLVQKLDQAKEKAKTNPASPSPQKNPER